MYQLYEPWAAPQTGTAVLGLLDDAPFADAALPGAQDPQPIVQSGLERPFATGRQVAYRRAQW
ncbi:MULTISPECIES: hypothetical protein [unclassified Streptomyces]|uniref:hypothetical protein n=1 Tax=unclassified Streptomyces TaxID=2593676 RepID=UPI002DD98721|nr:hypothetical protein [Streptomyces sp. NBC_01750]WSB04272.1 hypothetical protein OIE54_36425 [Streptomyces sp. NBC_01794]WSD31451.1 hypothetical protein OG966_05690 [Streptomyces sp. NBC_01750]